MWKKAERRICKFCKRAWVLPFLQARKISWLTRKRKYNSITAIFRRAEQKFEDYLSKFPDGKYALDANFYKSEMYANQKNWVKAVAGYEMVADKAPNKFAEKSILQAARINFFNLKDYAKVRNILCQTKRFCHFPGK